MLVTAPIVGQRGFTGHIASLVLRQVSIRQTLVQDSYGHICSARMNQTPASGAQSGSWVSWSSLVYDVPSDQGRSYESPCSSPFLEVPCGSAENTRVISRLLKSKSKEWVAVFL
jgi:hypothetical protein